MKVRLTKARTFELDADKPYLIFLKRNVATEDQAKELALQLKDIGVKNVVVALADKNSYKIVELPQAAKKVAKIAQEKQKAASKKKTKGIDLGLETVPDLPSEELAKETNK